MAVATADADADVADWDAGADAGVAAGGRMAVEEDRGSATA